MTWHLSLPLQSVLSAINMATLMWLPTFGQTVKRSRNPQTTNSAQVLGGSWSQGHNRVFFQELHTAQKVLTIPRKVFLPPNGLRSSDPVISSGLLCNHTAVQSLITITICSGPSCLWRTKKKSLVFRGVFF
jgi:hypothetical protein